MSLFDTHHEDTDDEDTETTHETKEEADDVAFVAKLKSSRTLASILKTIQFADVSRWIIIEEICIDFIGCCFLCITNGY